MAECIGCLYDEPMVGAHHVQSTVLPGIVYHVACTRGPIERELRALEMNTGLGGLSAGAVKVWKDANDALWYARSAGQYITHPEDVASEAIEAAAALGL